MQAIYEIPVRVYHEDTDGGGIVYYANYLKFMERARTEYLRSLGFEQDDLKQRQRCIFVVTHVDIKYHRPAKFNDLLSVSCELQRQRGASFTVRQTVAKANRADTGLGSDVELKGSIAGNRTPVSDEILTSSTVTLACLHSETLAAARIPSELVKALAASTRMDSGN